MFFREFPRGAGKKNKMAAGFAPKISFYLAEFTILIFVSGIQYNF